MRKRGIVDEVLLSSLTRAEKRKNSLRRLCQEEIFERGEAGERGRAVAHTPAVTLLARIPPRAPFSSREDHPHQLAPNRESMISGKGRWRLRVECL